MFVARDMMRFYFSLKSSVKWEKAKMCYLDTWVEILATMNSLMKSPRASVRSGFHPWFCVVPNKWCLSLLLDHSIRWSWSEALKSLLSFNSVIFSHSQLLFHYSPWGIRNALLLNPSGTPTTEVSRQPLPFGYCFWSVPLPWTNKELTFQPQTRKRWKAPIIWWHSTLSGSPVAGI